MTRFLLFITILSSSCIELIAQTTTVATGVINVGGMALNGNDLYLAESGGGKVSKIDITTSTQATATDVIATESPTSLEINGGDLYIASSSSNKIYKVDIMSAMPTLDVVTEEGDPNALALIGNDLYIGELDTNKISKIDITASIPIATNQVVGITGECHALALNGNDLYFSQSDKISKIDITELIPTITDVITVGTSVVGMAFNENDLYFTRWGSNTLYMMDVTESTPTIIDVVTVNNANSLSEILINGNDIYISKIINFASGEIVKYTIPTLSVEGDFAVNNGSIKIFPNPSTTYIQVSGLTKTEKYIVYNVLGVEISNGIVSENKKINLEKLSNGTYFLKISNYDIIKFIKE